MNYKDYEITDYKNEYGYYEATNTLDCDSYMLHDTTIGGLIIQIDEL